MACQTPLFLKSGSLGSGGKASSNSAPMTAVARTSLVAAGFDSVDPGGFGESAPAKTPLCDDLSALSNILGSVPTAWTGVNQVPSGKRFSS